MKLREMRERKKLTQEQVGKALNITQSRVSMMEQGKRGIKLSEGIKLAKMYGVSVHDLVKDNE